MSLAPSDPLFTTAIALAALLTVSAGRELPWVGGEPIACPRWLPWGALAVLAVTSTIFGILNPQAVAMAAGEGMLGTAALAGALAQF